MSKLSKGQKIIIIVLTICIIILIRLILYTATIVADNSEESNVSVEIETTEPETLGSILKEYDVEFKKRDGTTIYVTFNKSLYNEDGTSNEKYFTNLVNELATFLKKTFYLVDEEHDIDIKVFYMNNDEPVVRINNQEDLYGNTDGKTYYEVEHVDIIDSTNILTKEETVDALNLFNMNFDKFVERYGQPIEQDENGYYLFDEGNIKIAKYDNSRNIKNIVYSEKYLNDFSYEITEDYSLDKVQEVYGKAELGSLLDEYLGYRNGDFYMFFYEDEISVYPYGYEKNSKFEQYLEDYEIDSDLNALAKKVRTLWDGYFEYEYEYVDESNQYLLLTYPTKGVKIEIVNGNTKEITFYSNYYFSDTLKEKIKNGYYTINADDDFLDIIEFKRRNSN